jgi:hypothetical protein
MKATIIYTPYGSYMTTNRTEAIEFTFFLRSMGISFHLYDMQTISEIPNILSTW